MKTQLLPFENYVTSLTELGVFPSFDRKYNGWTCILRNSASIKLMPPDDDECWAEAMIDALTIAVEKLNKRFDSPKDLQRFIDSGVEQNLESMLNGIESLHGTSVADNAKVEEIKPGQVSDDFLN